MEKERKTDVRKLFFAFLARITIGALPSNTERSKLMCFLLPLGQDTVIYSYMRFVFLNPVSLFMNFNLFMETSLSSAKILYIGRKSMLRHITSFYPNGCNDRMCQLI